MAYPVAKVSVAFNDGPYVVSPTWTDITSSVRSMSIERGKSDEWGTYSGSATVVLNNRDRLYDPFYTSGTYYGKLLPRRQIKIEAINGVTTYSVFRGFIDGWPPTWTDAGGDSTVTLSCYDAMQLLAQVQLPADWSKSYILSQSPRHYYPCDDPIIQFQTGTLTDLGTTAINMTYQTNAAPGSQLADGLANASLAGASSTGTGYIATNDPGIASRQSAFSANANFTLCFWCVPETNAAGIISGQCANFAWSVNFSSGKFTVGVDSYIDQYTYSYTTTTQQLNQSEAYHFALAWDGTAKTASIYVNGVNVTGTKTSAPGLVLYTYADFVTVSQGPIQQIIVWVTNVPSPTVIQNIIKYSQASFYETTAARVARIIAETPFSSSLVNATGSNYIAEITDDAPFALPELQKTANTEGGPMWVDRSGILQQLPLAYAYQSYETPAITFGEGGSGLGQNVAIRYDGDSMRNILNVNMTGGGVTKVTGSIGTSTYGQATQTWDGYQPSISQATKVGSTLVGFGQYVFPALEDFEVGITPNAAWGTILELDFYSRIAVAIKPPSGNTITLGMLLTKVRHEVTPGTWRTFMNGSVRWASPFRLNASILNGTDVIVYTQ